MKDQYVGDQNDYAKYQLLRLSSAIFEEVIVAWMLTPPDGRTDGNRIGYLSQPEMRRADPELFDRLAELVANGKRSVAAVAAAQILPAAQFEDSLVPTDLPARAAYFDRLAASANAGSLVFFDPDNGLEIGSVAKHRRGAEKYLYWDELKLVAESGASLAIYQHFPRVDRVAYVEAALERLRRELSDDCGICAAHTSQVAFLFAARDPYLAPLLEALANCCDGFGPLSLVAPE
jgi:hypothetical protein